MDIDDIHPCIVDHCGDINTDKHHRKARSAGGSDKPANIAYLCRRHHDWVHNKPYYAQELGLIYPSYIDEPIEELKTIRIRPKKEKPKRTADLAVEKAVKDSLR